MLRTNSEPALAAGFARLLVLLTFAFLLVACQRAPHQSNEAGSASKIDMATTQRLAEAAYQESDWRGAEPHYTVLVREFPAEARLWFRLGNIYARTDRPDLAVGAYRECLVRTPDFAKAWFNMGVVQLRQAANSFHKMDAHVEEHDPVRESANRAYRKIQEILDDNGDEPAVASADGEHGGVDAFVSEPLPDDRNAVEVSGAQEGIEPGAVAPSDDVAGSGTRAYVDPVQLGNDSP